MSSPSSPAATPATASSAESLQPPAAGPRLNVLVVDDSKLARQMTINHLKAHLPHASFTEAASGEDGLQSLLNAPAALVILDYNMSGINGLEAAERMRARYPLLPIVLLTANGQAAVQARADALGVHLMRKPMKAELAGAMSRLVGMPALA